MSRWRGWPAAAHRDAWSRYRFQVEALRRACEASGGRVQRTTTRAELDRHLASGAVSAVLGMAAALAMGMGIKTAAAARHRPADDLATASRPVATQPAAPIDQASKPAPTPPSFTLA